METVKTVPPGVRCCVGDYRIADLPLDDCPRMGVTTVAHQGIFENAFADEWTASEPDTLTRSETIDHIIQICDFPADSIMVKYIGLQWSTLAHVVSVGLDEVNKFFTGQKDGFTFKDTPMLIHLRKFKSFLLYYKSKTCWGKVPTDDDVVKWTTKDVKKYCSSKAYHDDYAATCPTTPLKPSQRAGIYCNFRGMRNGSGSISIVFPVKVHQGVTQDKTFDRDLKDIRDNNAWEENINAVTQMDCIAMFLLKTMFPRMTEKRLCSRK
jgi:hypothetical protein